MENVSAIRMEIRKRYDSMYLEEEEKTRAYQATLVAEMPEMKPLKKGHSKGGQILGVIGSVIWPVVLGFLFGSVIGGGIGIFACVFVVISVSSIVEGEVSALHWILIGGYIIGMVITFFAAVSNAGTKRENKKIQRENDEKMKRYNETLQDISDKKAKSNQKLAQERQKMTDAANAAIAKYDSDVDAFCQQALGNGGIEPMVAKTVEMFQRMISHQESGADVKYVEAKFNYEVRTTGIVYMYESGYSNPESEFNFQKERFHDLNRSEECEGLAKALSVLVIAKMKEEYPSELTTIRVSNEDARFHLHFKTANENFEAAKDIF